MSGSSGPMKLEVRYCAMANEPPATSTAGQHDDGKERQLAPSHLADLERIQAGDLPGHDDRNAHCTKGDRRGVDNQAQAGGIQRLEAQPDQQRRGDRHRRAEAGRTFQEGTEGEADHQHLQALVLGDRQDRGTDDVELPGLDRDFVQEHRADDDPGDRPQAVNEAEAGCAQRLGQRHAIEQQRHAQRDGHGDRAGEPALHPQYGQGDEEERDRQQRDQAGQPQVAGGVVQVLPGLHEGSRLGAGCAPPQAVGRRGRYLLVLPISKIIEPLRADLTVTPAKRLLDHRARRHIGPTK
ncbi:hypothetical protein G6F57_017071 [Rhizopus arrhizus]|nr:hypothetical protein G6F57_017071 [Rhizopus arrhizus]